MADILINTCHSIIFTVLSYLYTIIIDIIIIINFSLLYTVLRATGLTAKDANGIILYSSYYTYF